MLTVACTVGEPEEHIWPPSTTSTTDEPVGSTGEQETDESTGDESSTGGESDKESSGESGSESSSSIGEPQGACIQHWVSLDEALEIDFTEDSCLVNGTDLMPLGLVLTVQPEERISLEDATIAECLAPEHVQDLLFFPAVEECRDQLVDMGCDMGVLDYPNLATSLCYHTLRPVFDLPVASSYETRDAVDACQEVVSC